MILALIINVEGQNPYLVLTFTAVDNAENIQLDSVKIMNRTQDCDTVLSWPDTMLILGSQVGTPEINDAVSALQVFQNYPNPVTDKTIISMYVPEKDNVSVFVNDVMGRITHKSEMVLEKGHHSFRFSPGNGNLFFFTAQWRGESSSIRIISARLQTSSTSLIEYIGSEASTISQKIFSAIQNFAFSFGDTLLYVGYTDTLQSGILDSPEIHETFTFQFATNIPCPGMSTVDYEGQIYNTIQIFSQCWLKENLNVGTMTPGAEEMSDNGIIEKYCYNDDPDSCFKFGGLYQWNEMMQYTTQQGAQGICPPDWHLPTDKEWKVLEGVVDSQYGIGDLQWDNSGYRGFDAGTNLKTTNGWYVGGNGTDLFGFSGLPGGYRYPNGSFDYIGSYGNWWASTEYGSSTAWFRSLDYDDPGVYRFSLYSKLYAFSVRCVRDY